MNGCDDGDPSAARRRRRVTIVNERGLHARAAARFAKLAEAFDARIVVSSKGYSVSGLSIMGLMMLAAGPGTEVEIAAAGSEAEAALAALAALVEDGFEEN
ncbi:MAG: HPr family phosphocarrier protein [Alphaproteobacteria bacterium]|nr:HPr family phosphocarrier protein [Alphaproteobacteria bacterium]